MSCKDFGLPEPHINEICDIVEFNLESINYSEQKFNSMFNQLNEDQKYIFEIKIS